MDEMLFVSIDPAAGGPQSDYCVVSFVRQHGVVTVRVPFARLPWYSFS